MDLCEKLLAPLTEGELAALDVRARVHVAVQLDLPVAVQDSREEENTVDGQGSERVSSPVEKNAVDVSNPDQISSQPREEAGGRPNPNVMSSQPGEKVVDVPTCTRSPIQPQENAADVGYPHITRSQSQELEISSIPLDIDLEDDLEREIRVAIPAKTSHSKSADRSTSEIPLEAYGVEVQNVQTAQMRIGTEAEKLKARKKLVANNYPRTSSIRDLGDIRYIEWISNDAPEKLQSSALLGFRTPEQANEVIKIGLDWCGLLRHCRKYARNCRARQCTICQVYGHGEKQCTSLPRCMSCSGQHSTSQCSSRIIICALCGGGHPANSPLCSKLAAERERVSNALLDRDIFWPVKDTKKKGSRATQKENKSLADHLSPKNTKTTKLPDLSYDGFISQSKAIWPAIFSQERECLAAYPLKSESPNPSGYQSAREQPAKKGGKTAKQGGRTAKEGGETTKTEGEIAKDGGETVKQGGKTAKKALKALSGSQPKAEQRLKSRRGNVQMAFKSKSKPDRKEFVKQWLATDGMWQADGRWSTDGSSKDVDCF